MNVLGMNLDSASRSPQLLRLEGLGFRVADVPPADGVMFELEFIHASCPSTAKCFSFALCPDHSSCNGCGKQLKMDKLVRIEVPCSADALVVQRGSLLLSGVPFGH